MSGKPPNYPRSQGIVRYDLAPRRGSGAKPKHSPIRIGDRFGSVVVSGFELGERGGVRWIIVQCDCGSREQRAHADNLRKGKTQSCYFCAQKKRNRSSKKYWGYADIVPDQEHRTRLLNRISAAITRCHNPNDSSYHSYGGRGIYVHSTWRQDKEDRRKFLAHLISLDGWDDPQLELDRIDCDRGYEPGNLRFCTRHENLRNKRRVQNLQQRIIELEAEIARLRSSERRTS